jgi:hypothetical protein
MGRMTTAPPLQLIVGPAGHGVAAYAADVASALRTLDARTGVAHAEKVTDAIGIADGASRVHLHVTDRLLGRSPEEAAEHVERLAASTHLTLTVHDVPQTSDGTPLPRRISAYSRFLAAAHATAVNSRHEQRLVEEFLPNAPVPHAIPLGSRRAVSPPVPRACGERDADESSSRSLVVLIAGYVYPGKGHAQAIEATADAAGSLRAAGEAVGDVVVRAIGRASAGHESDVAVLRADAERRGVRFEVTDFLPDDVFAARISEDGIPLAAHAHVSASRSMLDWVEAGRRPLVVASRYAEEMRLLRPGTIALYEPSRLASRLIEAWQEPARTWLKPGLRLTPTLVDAAEDYLTWWAGASPR